MMTTVAVLAPCFGRATYQADGFYGIKEAFLSVVLQVFDLMLSMF